MAKKKVSQVSVVSSNIDPNALYDVDLDGRMVKVSGAKLVELDGNLVYRVDGKEYPIVQA